MHVLPHKKYKLTPNLDMNFVITSLEGFPKNVLELVKNSELSF